jgi:N-acetylgalactosamine-N,N'-diacetylbacillosaminyl-diphospho-undecaprenol 4-alpha-N-acetylgalactosaminyltransferase
MGSARDLKNNFNINKNISTIYSPIDIDYIINQSTKKSDIIIEKDTLNFVTVGRLDDGKNHNMMIKAFSRIHNKNSKLYILGDGELKDELVSLVNNLNMKERIIFLGFDKNPFRYMIHCDIFLFTSRFEGFPTVLIEAMVCKLPIISTDCKSGPREILVSKESDSHIIDDIEIGKYGILTPVDNQDLFQKAIDTLVKDTSLRQSYIQNSIARVKTFSKDYSIKQIQDILNTTLNLKID